MQIVYAVKSTDDHVFKLYVSEELAERHRDRLNADHGAGYGWVEEFEVANTLDGDLLFVNVYEVDRAYGGAEEGGWWYTTGTYDAEQSFKAADVESAQEYAELLSQRLEGEEADLPALHSVLYRGGRHIVKVESTPGRDFPETRPHYE